MSEQRAEYTIAELEAAGHKREDLRLPAKRRSGSKYGNKRTPCAHGHLHASGAEARRCDELHLLYRAHKIYALAIQPRFVLETKFRRDGKTYRGSSYRGDFFYLENFPNGTLAVCEDVKAMNRRTGKPITTALFRQKWKSAIRLNPGIMFRIVEA